MPEEPTVKKLNEHVIALATALSQLNGYGPRMPSVDAICATILMPSPHEARASEDLAALKAVLPKRGRLKNISCDWDPAWNFVFTFRFENGFFSGDGFDLRKGEPGYEALLPAIESCRILITDCQLEPPSPAKDLPLRRLVYPKAAATKAA